MKKFKFLTTLFASIISMSALAGCSTPPTQEDIDEAIVQIIPSPESIQREGVNIESITFENVPSEIKIGYFDTYNIELKIVYCDAFIEHYPLKMANFPDGLKHVFNVVGEHTVTIAFRGHEVSYVFNVVEGMNMYLVRFYSYDGKIIRRFEVDPSVGHIPDDPPDGPVRENDSLFNYNFISWDQVITKTTEIYKNMDIYPLYKKIQKRYDVTKQVVPTVENGKMHIMHSSHDGAKYYFDAFIYMGRIDRVPLLTSTISEVTTTNINGEMYFDNSKTQEEHTLAIISTIMSKGMNVDTSNASQYFTTMNSAPDAPEYNTNTAFDITMNTAGDTSILFDGDIAYSEVYKGNLAEFVSSHREDNKTSYNINVASDMAIGNSYYRAAVEASVDVVAHAQYYYNSSSDVKIQFMYYKYYFMLNLNNTFKVAEYSADNNFNSTGTRLSYSMKDITDLLIYIGEEARKQ